jgi:hypothetical protein
MKSFKILAIFLLFALLLISEAANRDEKEQSKVDEKCDEKNCRLPLCKCSNTQKPDKIDLADTPMMVALSFNGVLTTEHSRHIKKILNPIFKNPNGCGIQGTFFVSDSGNGTTDYCLVQTLFNNNNEIGVGASKYL